MKNKYIIYTNLPVLVSKKREIKRFEIKLSVIWNQTHSHTEKKNNSNKINYFF